MLGSQNQPASASCATQISPKQRLVTGRRVENMSPVIKYILHNTFVHSVSPHTVSSVPTLNDTDITMMDSSPRTGTMRASFTTHRQLDEICMETCERALLFFKCAFGRAVVVVMAVGGGGGQGRGGGLSWLLSSLLSAPSLGQAGRLCWAARLLGSRCEPSCQRQAVARRSAARAHTSLSHLP